MSVPDAYPRLSEELRLETGVPVISLKGLMLIKLIADRPRDQEDIRTLLASQPGQLRGVRSYVHSLNPSLATRLAEIIA